MSEKPEALRLVDEYAQEVKDFGYVESSYVRAKLENHLACLHAEVEALRQANEAFAQRQEWWNDRMCALEAGCEALRVALGEIAWSNDSKWQSDRADAALNPPAAIDAAMEQTK